PAPATSPAPPATPAAPAPSPQLTVTGEAIDPSLPFVVEQSGNALAPHLHLKVPAPRGFTGPAAAIRDALDYDNSHPPNNGQIPTWNETEQKWQPSDFASKHPQLFSIPESAFTNVTQIINGRVPILSYPMPVFDFAWVPYVTGHFKAFGVDLNILDPFKIGAEVRIGDPVNGQLVGRGKGTIAQETTVIPHFSSHGDPDTAVTPDNGTAQINAGQQMTLTVNLVNDGILGAYSFNRADAQLSVLAVPQGL
ncbi:phage tail protein, partial [Mycolicibacterium insubricum]|uniref:phage tail protein n=1 Tax=Mycolicibacterium insubricum TaxID=444597 RepID=UPI0021F2DB09